MPRPPMNDAAAAVLRRAIRALQREGGSGCLDSVPNGVGQLVGRLLAELADVDLPENARASLRRLHTDMRGYDRMTPAQREVLVERAVKLLEALVPPPPTKSPQPPKARQASEDGAPLSSEDPVTELRGVGPARAEALATLGIHSIGDLLLHLPARYEDRRQVLTMREIKHGQNAVVHVRVTGAGRRSSRFRGAAAIVPAASGGVEGELVFFGRAYLVESLRSGDELLVIGTARVERGCPSIAVGEFEKLEDGPEAAARIVPIYRITDGISQGVLSDWIAQALQRCALPEDALPERLRRRRGLMSLAEALREMHEPSQLPAAEAARHRLAYEELLAMQLVLALRRRGAKRPCPAAALETEGLREEFVAALPFEPTGAQSRVIDELLADLTAEEPGHRLIHGEVGSGKTVVAALALAAAARAGRQGAMMAPTELLAEQHHESLLELLGPLGIEPVLLTGGIAAAERAEAFRALESGEARCAVGTHALFSEGLRFADLAVAVIDEQHRFGVRQRARLFAKGERPNLFVMSATPIPRTLALAVHGDFDISVLAELPPGRRQPQTVMLPSGQRDEAWQFAREQVSEGRQAYVVCPAIDPSDEMAAATETVETLRAGPLAGLRVGMVHGRMEGEQRQETMAAFRVGELDVLVATSLIEVGVNVPNANTIVIENAERFGLAQLHQLRGRVARAGWQPHCLLLTESRSPETLDRIAVLTRTCDGFEIAEEDLRRRGPGEFEGVRQSGLPDLCIASIIADTPALAAAREDAFALIAEDPRLARPEHQGLRRLVARSRTGGVWML